MSNNYARRCGRVRGQFNYTLGSELCMCITYISKILPFNSISNRELNGILFDSLCEKINKLNNINLDQSSGNIKTCKYYKLNEIKNIFTE